MFDQQQRVTARQEEPSKNAITSEPSYFIDSSGVSAGSASGIVSGRSPMLKNFGHGRAITRPSSWITRPRAAMVYSSHCFS